LRIFLQRAFIASYTQQNSNNSLLSIVPLVSVFFSFFFSLSLLSTIRHKHTSAQLSTNNVIQYNNCESTLQIFSNVSTRNNQIKSKKYCKGNLRKSRNVKKGLDIKSAFSVLLSVLFLLGIGEGLHKKI
jgi:hypothetical protein